MQYPSGATIAVADGQKLRVFRNSGDENDLRLEELEDPHLLALHGGSSHRHHGSSGNPDHVRSREDGFASATAAWLNQQVLSGKISHLFVIAPPRTLGELRLHYHKSLEAMLLGEISGEHTGDSIEHLHQVLAKA